MCVIFKESAAIVSTFVYSKYHCVEISFQGINIGMPFYVNFLRLKVRKTIYLLATWFWSSEMYTVGSGGGHH
jgi:hypothetical protein